MSDDEPLPESIEIKGDPSKPFLAALEATGDLSVADLMNKCELARWVDTVGARCQAEVFDSGNSTVSRKGNLLCSTYATVFEDPTLRGEGKLSAEVMSYSDECADFSVDPATHKRLHDRLKPVFGVE